MHESKSISVRRDVRMTCKSSCLFSLLAWVVTNRFWQTTLSRILWNDFTTIARYRITGINENGKVLQNPGRTIRPFEVESIFIKISCD
jgi:hypothetical protein